MQKLFDHTFIPIRTCDRRSKQIPKRFVVCKVDRVTNTKLYGKYVMKCDRIRKAGNSQGLDLYSAMTSDVDGIEGLQGTRPLEPKINEWHLFHGTSPENAKRICETGFQQNSQKKKGHLLYGPGTYFAESCFKADEYAGNTKCDDTGLFCMLLARVVGGRVYFTSEVKPSVPELRQFKDFGYNSILGDR